MKRLLSSVAVALVAVAVVALGRTSNWLTTGEARAQSSHEFTTSAQPRSTTIARGSTVTMRVSVTSKTGSQAIVDVEFYSTTGQKAYQRYFTDQSFAAGQTRNYSTSWAVPSTTPTGMYRVKIGVFSTNWSTLYSWNDAAAELTVSSAAATSTPTSQATSTPTAHTATSTPTLPATATPTARPPTATPVPPTATPLPTSTPASTTRTYSTNFPASENPISEGGRWINGAATGVDWSDVRTTLNRAFGTQAGNSAAVYDDSEAVLTGTWGSDQAAAATIYVTSPMSESAEVELRLRSSISAHNSIGYEFECSVSSNQYMDIVRWDGPVGRYTYVARSTGNGCANGDVVGATIVGSKLTMYKNGVAVLSGTDTAYPSGGAPGVGFFLRNQTGTNANYGFSKFAANDTGTLPILN